MRVKWKLVVASLKMFFREREAVFWTFFLPLFMIFLFGFVKFDQSARIKVGVVNESGVQADALLSSLRHVQGLLIVEGSREGELHELQQGERELVLVIPPSFPQVRQLVTYSSNAKAREAQVATLLVKQVADEELLTESGRHGVAVVSQAVDARDLTYLDFLVPGILAMSIMQMGIFGVAFVFVDLKKRGILRRMRVTPINPNDFILAQVFMRLVILMLQISLLVGAGMIFFHFQFVGSLLDLFLLGLLGAVVFLAMGFALAGISKNEDQVAPIANMITLPMTLLCGIFFSRTHLPGVVRTITEFFPLTYLADGMRSVAIEGAGLVHLSPQLIGLSVWSVLSCFVAVKMFRWE